MISYPQLQLEIYLNAYSQIYQDLELGLENINSTVEDYSEWLVAHGNNELDASRYKGEKKEAILNRWELKKIEKNEEKE